MVMSNKCKNCSGELVFDAGEQKLKCTHCSSLFEIETENKKLQKKLFNEQSSIKSSRTKYTQFYCVSCGRKHITSSILEISRCPFCGDSRNLTKTLKIDYVPDGIIPFKINKQNALSRLVAWIKKQKFAPNNLKQLAKNDSIVGIYSPSYFYDFTCFSTYSGTGLKQHRDRSGRMYQSRHFFRNNRKDRYEDYIESAGPSISSEKLRSIGGYSQNNILVYRTEYLYGWLGEEVTDLIQSNVPNMKKTVSLNIAKDVRMSLPYNSVENFQISTSFSDIYYEYIYIPIWKGKYKYKNKEYPYFINGENGKVTGKAPKSFWKIFFTTLFILGIVGTFIYFVMTS